VAKRSRKGVVVEAGDDGVDVCAAGGHEPQHGDGGGAEAGVEEVGRVRVASVRPTAPRLGLLVVVVVVVVRVNE
jgi:hypothetical protein